MSEFFTADLVDANPEIAAADGLFRDFGGQSAFSGPMVTLKVFEDNEWVRTVLEEPGDGRVLVVDGGGSLRCALVGGNLAQLALTNGWRGLLVNGAVRDSGELRGIPIGIKALGTHPRRSAKGLHTGHRDRPVIFAGVTFRPGQWLYADADGVLIADRSLEP